MTLADKNYDANMAIIGNVAMHVVPPGGKVVPSGGQKKIFRFLEDFQIFGRFSDFWKIF